MLYKENYSKINSMDIYQYFNKIEYTSFLRMSTSPELATTPEKKDDDELVVKRVVRERGSDRPSEIIVSKGGVECTVTPRQVVKIDIDDFPPEDNAKTRGADIKPAEEPQEKEETKEEPKNEQQESTAHSIYTKVADTCSNAFQSVKGWFSNLF